LFQQLDPALGPRLTILALPFDSYAEVILVSSERFPAAPEWFDGLGSLFSALPDVQGLSLDPDRQPVLGKAKQRIWQAVQNMLDEHTGDTGRRAFTGLPEFIHGYCVLLILQVSYQQLQSHPYLTRNAVLAYPAETSFMHEVIFRCLNEYAILLLRLLEGNAVYPLPHGAEEILRQAGRATGGERGDSLFQACNAISALRYEGSGRLLMAADHPSVHVVLNLHQPVHLRNYRGIRKLLEVSTDDLHLLYAADHIYGVGQLSEVPYQEQAENLFVVEFAGAHTWRLLHAQQQLMAVSYGVPRLPRRPLRKERKEVFQPTRIYDRHGSLLVELFDPSAG
jgi:hypothetical protein